MIECLSKYFNLPQDKKKLLEDFAQQLILWNEKVNLISRKDIENLCERHILHSLTIAKYFDLSEKKILDVGSGGGLPGIPLAIYFPTAKFTLIDSITKKTAVLENIICHLSLKNVETKSIFSKELKGKYDIIIGRAVSDFQKFYKNTKHLLQNNSQIIYLKGGDVQAELSGFKIGQINIIDLSADFKEDFFETKKIIRFVKK